MGSKDLVVLSIATLVCIAFLGAVQTQATDGANYGAECTYPVPSPPPANLSKTCLGKEFLRCVNTSATTGVCGCIAPMIRDHEMNKCLMPVGLPNAECWTHVSDGGFPTPCTNNSHCFQLNSTIAGKCECQSDYDATPYGECKLTFGASTECQKHTDCNINSYLTCGPNKTCECDKLFTWDYTTLKCAGLAGGYCNTTAGRPCLVGSNTVCNETATTCSCSPDFQATEDGLCLKGHSMVCSANSDCDPKFTCREYAAGNTTKTCQCPLNRNFEDGICKLLAGETCIIGDLEQTCTKSSTCFHNTNNITACVCDAYYAPTDAKLCLPDHGASCSTTNVCNAERYLECGSSNTCTCKADYSFEENVCKGNIGQECRLGGNNCLGISECVVYNSTSSVHFCKCPGASVPSGDSKNCYLDYAAACTGSIECNPEAFLSCNVTSSTCDCDNPEVHIYQNSNCRIKSGNECGGSAQRQTCVANSICSASNICACNQGFSEDSFGQCIVGGGGGGNSGAGNLQASLIFVGLLIMGFMGVSKSQ